ncbi:MAG TPA: hypothetical protein PKA42_03465 [Candidatus Paceibacterota bacterium]|nr:hypothetical protein [Candidatus Paceibacterota bacterium]HMO83201.1 hypothetical protein [Candidatus Paceibacterota bacterium]
MEIKYIINKNSQSTGEHEVHAEIYCSHLPLPENRIALGNYDNCSDPIREAKSKWPHLTIDGCKHCIPQCHTR